jgi:mRNA-degrading endonuclease RelE of RelBE toxin-antitoxin system
MKSTTSERFRKTFRRLPPPIRKQARDAYKLFKTNPYHSSLHFKRVSNTDPVYSARVSLDYRVLGILKDNHIIWFWIGSHADYDKIISQL